MVEFAPTDEPEAQRRRSTRLVQSVPLTVEGVDALGQSFKERTSTLMINCHGCKFLSKHYVLKGSWLTLEIPRAEPGREPLPVRAQVEWVQRPRTVRELFQIGVELEVPGNVWGIAFPPADWFPYPEESLPEIPAAALKGAPPAAPPAEPAKPVGEEKIHTVPRAGAAAPPPAAAVPPPPAAPAAAAPQLDQLLAEARQQIQKIVRETVHTVATAETDRLMQELSRQLEQAANQAVETAAKGTTDQVVAHALQKIAEERQASAEAVQQEWSATFERGLSDAASQLVTRFQEASTPLHDNFRERLEADLAKASARTEEVARQAQELENTLNVHLAEAQARLAELHKEMEAAAAAARSSSESRVQDLEHSTQQLTKATQDALAQAIAEAQARLAELRKELESATATAQATGQAQIRTLEESAESLHRETADSLRSAVVEARVQLTELRREMAAAADAMRSISEERRKELADASQKLGQDAAASLAQQLATWRDQLESDMALAGMEWNSMLEEAVLRGTERLTTQLDQLAGGAVARTEQDLQARTTSARKSLEEAATTIEQSFHALRETLRQDLERAGASLAEIDRATSRVEEYAARVQAAGRDAAQELERRSGEILESRAAELARHAEGASANLTQRAEAATAELVGRAESASADLAQRAEAASAELARRAEGLSSETLKRLQPQLESTAQHFLAELATHAEQQLGPQLARASEVAERLASTREQAARELEAHRTRLLEAAEEQLRASLAQLQASSEELRKSFADSGRADLEKWLKELDEKSTDATHTTFEALYKAAEWYQKKAQTAMQTALDRMVEESGSKLREQAAEISRIFAGELDHRSRSYVEHTQGMLEETAKELTEKARGQFDELKDTRLASFDDQTHQVAQGMLDSMGEAADRTFAEKMAQVTAQFERRVGEHMEKATAAAQQELEASLLSIMDAWRVERETQQQAVRRQLAQVSDGSVDNFKERLENASNAWLAASMATLQARAQSTMATFGASTEEKVREAVASTLAGLADTMRQSLLALSAQVTPPPKPPEEK